MIKSNAKIKMCYDYRKPGRGCGVRRIATYPFTAPVGRIALEPTLLHALTQTG